MNIPTIAPMLAGGQGIPLDPTSWVFEPKWDGIRAVARVGGEVSLASRLGNDITAGYPELGALGPALVGRAAVLDGEIIAFDEDGRPSFERLQARMHVRNPSRALLVSTPVLYLVFDLLWLDGEMLVDRPLTARRQALDELGLTGANWTVSKVLPGPPTPEALAACRDQGLEGYMGKLSTSVYLPGRRSRSWTKIKAVRTRELVVGGWSEGSGGRAGQVGSLAVGTVDPQLSPPPGLPFALRYLGQVGSGLSEALLGRLTAELAHLAVDVCPFVPRPAAPLHWVEPRLVVEVAYSEVTTAGVLRQASIKALRDDVDPATVV